MSNRARRILSRSVLLLLAAGVVAVIIIAMMPAPIDVRTQQVTRGPLRVTVREEGRTRIRDRYIVSAPLAGQLQRIMLRPGDVVSAGDTVIARLEPGDPSLLDARAVAESEARVRRAHAALQRSEADVERVRSDMDLAENELTRTRSAQVGGAATDREVDIAAARLRSTTEMYHAARYEKDIAQFELELAEAALMRSRPNRSDPAMDFQMTIGSPIDGRVLRVFEESMAIVQAGTPLMELGDPSDLEVVVDVLSIDAVRIQPGAEVIFEYWGGPYDLAGRVRLVEPQAFTKVSALGVDEQRVNVVIDLLDPPGRRETLGDGYRVEARIVIWEEQDVLRVPTRALFRVDGAWAVFVNEAGTARVRSVEIGRQTDLLTQVLSGLSEGDEVILDPSDRLADGGSVVRRDAD